MREGMMGAPRITEAKLRRAIRAAQGECPGAIMEVTPSGVLRIVPQPGDARTEQQARIDRWFSEDEG